MLRPRVIVLLASLPVIGTAAPLAAQRLEVAARIGYSPSSGTEFLVVDNVGGVYRSWDGAALSMGALASYWPLTHFGMLGTFDLRLARAYETQPANDPHPARTIDTSTTQLNVSLRLAVRQAVGRAFQLTAGIGPVMVRFGDAEYYGILGSYLARQTAFGVAGGLSAHWGISPRLRLTLSAEDVVCRVQRQAVALPGPNTPGGPGISSVDAPLLHQLTFSAGVSARVL